jgi:hypothetical protein
MMLAGFLAKTAGRTEYLERNTHQPSLQPRP